MGERQIVLDSNGRTAATIELTAIHVVRLAEVGLWLVREEGESHESVSDWRQAHERYWAAEVIPQLPRASRRPIDSDTLVVLERFRVIPAETE